MAFKMKGSPMARKRQESAAVTNRRNEGDNKGARIEAARARAAAKGNTGKAARKARKLINHDLKTGKGKQPARTITTNSIEL